MSCLTFDRFLLSPGLSWIADKIFCLLDRQSVVNCEQACKLWRDYIYQSGLWRKFLLRSVAFPSTFELSMLDNLLGKEDPNWRVDRKPNFYRTLCHKLSRKRLKQNWRNGRYSVKTIVNEKIVRDLAILDHEKLAYACENTIKFSNRVPLRIPPPVSERDATASFHLEEIQVVQAHRREITCLAAEDNLVAVGGRDRRVSVWCGKSGARLAFQNEAHSRLITCVRLKNKSVFSSSRDRSIKIWSYNTSCQSLLLEQTLQDHGHSIWGIDVREPYLISSSADKTLNLWTRPDPSSGWILKSKFENGDTALRNVIILERDDGNLALSGDLIGELKVWNLREARLQYNVPEHTGLEGAWFRSSGAVVALSLNLDFAAASFGNKCVVLYSTETCQTSLPPCLVIDITKHIGEIHSKNQRVLLQIDFFFQDTYPSYEVSA